MYHILITRQYSNTQMRNVWAIEFGDYDRNTVKEEAKEYLREYKRKDIKIVTIDNARQSTVNHAIDCYNALEM